MPITPAPPWDLFHNAPGCLKYCQKYNIAKNITYFKMLILSGIINIAHLGLYTNLNLKLQFICQNEP